MDVNGSQLTVTERFVLKQVRTGWASRGELMARVRAASPTAPTLALEALVAKGLVEKSREPGRYGRYLVTSYRRVKS